MNARVLLLFLVAVRCGWAGSLRCNLYDKEGVPASPFRTDDGPATDGRP